MPTQMRLMATIATLAAGFIGGMADRQRSQKAPPPQIENATRQQADDAGGFAPLPAPTALPQSGGMPQLDDAIVLGTRVNLQSP